MTEYNLFCWSELFNDEHSFQQKRYRVFNQQVSKNRYDELVTIIRNIIPNNNNLKLSDFWKSLTSEQIKGLQSIPEFDAKGFEYITGLVLPKELSDVEKAIQLLTDKGLLKDGKVLV